MKSVVVLISGRGSNLEAILREQIPGVRYCAVVSSRADAGGLEIARRYGVPSEVVDAAAYPHRADFDAELARRVDALRPDLIVLAGFMRLLDAAFVERYEGRMLNIHPSLLPSFPGLHTHRRALGAGVRVHGATVHFVTPELDVGPIVIQAAVPVRDDDDERSLAERVLSEEHRIFPQAVRWFVEGRLRIEGGRVAVAGGEVSSAVLVSPLAGERKQ
jgi:phosphoribosylglycinamide formyltransferase 1